MTSLDKLCEIISADPDRLFLSLDLSVKKGFRSYSGSCPIHNGNAHSLSIYERNGSYYWSCKSSNCSKVFGGSLIGLTQGIFSVTKEGWEREGEKKYPFGRVVAYLKTLYNITGSDIEVTDEYLEKKKFIRDTEIMRANGYTKLCTREQYLSRVSLPSNYFQSRGFSKEILTTYDVGDYICYNKKAKLRGRAVIPIYDDDFKFVIGVSGRSINHFIPKWLHSDNFPSCYSLYNFWFAKDYIKKSRQVVLVEGPLDVWRLVEAGIKNVCGLMGNQLSTAKQLKLDALGVDSLTLMLDNDEGGNAGTKKIIEECSRYYNIKQIQLPENKDPGDLSTDDIRRIFGN